MLLEFGYPQEVHVQFDLLRNGFFKWSEGHLLAWDAAHHIAFALQ